MRKQYWMDYCANIRQCTQIGLKFAALLWIEYYFGIWMWFYAKASFSVGVPPTSKSKPHHWLFYHLLLLLLRIFVSHARTVWNLPHPYPHTGPDYHESEATTVDISFKHGSKICQTGTKILFSYVCSCSRTLHSGPLAILHNPYQGV